MNWRSALTPRRLRQLWYVPLLGTAMGLMLVRVLVMARLLDVQGFAQFSAGLLLSSSFCMLTCLGLHSMLQRELPAMIVRRRERPGAVLLAQSIIVALGLAAAGGAAAGAGWSVAGLSPLLVAVSVLHGLSQQVFLLVTVESRSRGEPLRFALQMLVRSLVVVAAGLAAAALHSAMAALLAEAVVSLALAQASLQAVFRKASIGAVAAYRAGFARLPRVRWRSALSLLLVSLMSFVMLYADRWIAAELLDTRGFALYAFAWTVLMIALSLQFVLNASIYPLIARRFASSGATVAFGISLRMSAAALLTGVVLALPLWWLLGAGVRRWFEPYAPAAPLIALFVAVAVLRVADFWTSFLIIAGLEGRLLALNVVTAAAAGLVWVGWVQPWRGAALAPWDIGLLAALLALGGYVVAALASWHAVRR